MRPPAQTLETIVETICCELSQGDAALSPAAMALLLRRYLETGRDDLGNTIGLALGRAVEVAPVEHERDRRAGWLSMFVRAIELSDDERLQAAAEALVASLRRDWPGETQVESATRALDACLAFVDVMADRDAAKDLAQAALDELERVIGLAYTPGGGVSHSIGGAGRARDAARGTLDDHVSAASALLTAFGMTRRLPYGMLADELMQFARRHWWDEAAGTFPDAPFSCVCGAARVLCRLSALHGDPEYRETAIVADCDYAADVDRIFASLGSGSFQLGADAAVYGLALAEWIEDRRALR